MPQMLVLELANNPGDAATIDLAGSPTGYSSWLSALGSGVRDDYVAIDSTGQREWGIGYPTAGTPNKWTRETILGGSLGAGRRVPFIGQIEIYSDIVLRGGLLGNNAIPQQLITQLQSSNARSIPNATGTTFGWDTIGASTLGGASGSGGNYNGIVVPSGGAYSIEAAILWASNGAGTRAMSLVINNALALAVDQKVAANLGQVSLRCGWRGGLNAGDTLTVQVSQDSGGALAAGGTLASNLSVVRL